MHDPERPRLRRGLDHFPSWMPQHPGVILRDPRRYADELRYVPDFLVSALDALDGRTPRAELARRLARRGLGAARAAEELDALLEVLDEDGYLEGPRFLARRDAKHDAFAAAPIRAALHAGSGYPDEPEALAQTLQGYLASVPGPRPTRPRPWRALAAPHVSPFGGPHAYGAAFRELGPHLREHTFVLLGTSHYGPPDRFGLTAKPYQTPLGTCRVDTAAVEALAAAAPEVTIRDDYCHAIEHALEFQVVFLQHCVAPDVRIVPILCGPLTCAPEALPEAEQPALGRFFAALTALQAARDDLTWILGIDLAHVGERYGHGFSATAGTGVMDEVEREDRGRLERVLAGDVEGFWQLAHPAEDGTNWCGTSTLYTFLRAVPHVRGELLRYDQWNIDPRSVVSFAGLGLADR